MAKKQTVRDLRNSPAMETTAETPYQINKTGIIPLFTALLYLGVHFIPDFEAYDAMGPQWFYMVCVDLLVSLYILARKDQYGTAAMAFSRNLFSWLYLAFFVLAGISILFAINPTEGLVNYVRLTATIVAFFNLGILFYQRTDLFRAVAVLISLVLLVESLQALSIFLNKMGTVTMVDLIKDIKAQAGNKNIFVSGIAAKIPFALYLIHSSRMPMRLVNILILLLATLTIFLLNSRASYMTLILIFLLYLIYSFLEARKEKPAEKSIFQMAYVLVPVIVALFISQLLLENVKSFEKESEPQLFGTVTERIGSISTVSDESNKVRLRLWSNALDYTFHHPLTGCGYGNWKIASIPYQRIITNDLYVPIHAHNDFIEAFAEMGIPGGLLYLSLFVCIAIFTLRTFRSEAAGQGIKWMSVFSFLAFVAYSSDAFFNFPIERPLNQMFFALFAALNVVAYLAIPRTVPHDESKKSSSNALPISVYGLVAVLILIPAAYVTYQTHRSLKVQRLVLADLNNEPLKMDWKTTVPSFPSIPNLSATAQPIDAIKGRYLYEAGQYDQALLLLDRGRKANPVIGYSEFLKAGLFYKTDRLDSAYTNAMFAFYTRPKAKTYYQTLIAILAKRKDTSEIKKAFAEFDRYRHEPVGWDLYLRGMLNAQGKGTRHLLIMADSALKMFANDPGVATIPPVRDEIIRFMENPTATNTTAGKTSEADVIAATKYYNDAVVAFGSGVAGKDNLEKAASLFLRSAALNPGNYVAYENAAICYFNMKQWQKSITYFNKVLATKLSTNGKPEYFKGVALYNTGQREEGCNYLKTSMAKGWKEAEPVVKANCK